jgi:hypothetical protein
MPGGGFGPPGDPSKTPAEQEADRKKRMEEQKRKMAAGPQRTGRKKKKLGDDHQNKLP